MLVQQLAAWIQAHPARPTWWRYTLTGTPPPTVFVDSMPDQPDAQVGLFHQPGPQPDDDGFGYDPVGVQAIVRGPATPAGMAQAYRWAVELRGLLAGASSIVLPDVGFGATTVVRITATGGGPVPMGTDDTGRHEYAVSLTVEVVAPTEHRPLG